MHKILRHLTFNLLLLLAAISGTACSLASAKTDNSGDIQNNQPVTIENKTALNNAVPQANRSTKPEITAALAAGTYKLDTYKNGSGNDNSLTIEDKGNGKLGVYISASYNYTNNGNESSHETEAEGDVYLKGSMAIGALKEIGGDDSSCRTTIIFGANQATIKVAANCHTNVALDGVYKKEKPKAANRNAENAAVRQISYDRLEAFINDFDNHRPGDRYVIVNVPTHKIEKTVRADDNGNASYKGLFYLQIDDDDSDVIYAFLTSAAMIKSLKPIEIEPSSIRATAVLIESTGSSDVYRTSFITKLEGLDDKGAVLWTATGTEPAKVRFSH